MTPIKRGKYEYQPASLVQIRQRLKLKQKKMAELLSIPPNTLSRWENGASTPDAQSLAAIYSLARERGVTVEFFTKRKPTMKTPKERSRLIMLWDFQYVPVSSRQLDDIVSWLEGQVRRRFSKASYLLFKGFVWDSQAKEAEELMDHGWRIFEDNEDLFEAICDNAKSDCGHDPQDTTLVLIARDEEFAELITELKGRGVRVYAITPPKGYKDRLVDAVGNKRWITLPEYYSPPFAPRVRGFIERVFRA